MTHRADNPVARPLDWRRSPADVAGAWPVDVPLAALVSADPDRADAGARWSILAPTDSAAFVRPASPSEPRTRAPEPRTSVSGLTPRMPDAQRTGGDAGPPPDATVDLPFLSGFLVCIPYEAGYAFEPDVFAPSAAHDADPIFIRVDAAFVHDAHADQWWLVGKNADAAEALERRTGSVAFAPPIARPCACAAFRAGELASGAGQARYTRDVARIIDRIRAGDVYQVNLAHHLRAPFEGSPRALFLRLLASARPAYAAIIEQWGSAPDHPRRAVLSISPELFLDADLSPSGGRRVVTRPIKGTRALPARALGSPTPLPLGGEDVRLGGQERGSPAFSELLQSQKDAAELAMIVDLMRNDLGRICEFGSIRVDSARDIETLAGGSLLHAVATVSGRLRDGATLDDLLRATFPPGSVTGAPKIAAMKIIRELEPAPRAAYCGAIGFVSDHGPARFSVAIRTATIAGVNADAARPCDFEGSIDFPVGAGIVADSDPDAEWRETLVKADAFQRALAPEPFVRFPTPLAEARA